MIAVRVVKIVLVAALALHASLVAFGNITDYGTNFSFVQHRAKAFAITGLLMGLLVWQVGFMTIAGEWFGMWMSQTWNGLPSAFRLVMISSVC